MNVVLLRVGIDMGSGGILSPLFEDGSFEFIPMWDRFDKAGVDARTYGNHKGLHGKPLIEYFPLKLQGRMRNQPMHFDPEFETFTYGDPTQGAKRGLRNLCPGDLLVFYSGLRHWNSPTDAGLYVIGYFEVELAGLATSLLQNGVDVETVFADNFHVRHRVVLETQRNQLVLVKGSPQSRLLTRAIPISELGTDVRGRPLHRLSTRMQGIFGDWGGRTAIQRSAPRWVRPAFIDDAAAFVKALP